MNAGRHRSTPVQDALKPSLGAREIVADRLRSCTGVPGTSWAAEDCPNWAQAIEAPPQCRRAIGPTGA